MPAFGVHPSVTAMQKGEVTTASPFRQDKAVKDHALLFNAIIYSLFFFYQEREIPNCHAEHNGKGKADGVDADVLKLRRPTGYERLMNFIEAGVEQRDDERDPAADGRPFVVRRFDRQRGGEQEARSAEQEIEKDVRQLADHQTKDNRHVRGGHSRRDLDA